MVGHQGVRVDCTPRGYAGGVKQLAVPSEIIVTEEGRLPIVSALRDVHWHTCHRQTGRARHQQAFV